MFPWLEVADAFLVTAVEPEMELPQPAIARTARNSTSEIGVDRVVIWLRRLVVAFRGECRRSQAIPSPPNCY
jgi:hypothetical protein